MFLRTLESLFAPDRTFTAKLARQPMRPKLTGFEALEERYLLSHCVLPEGDPPDQAEMDAYNACLAAEASAPTTGDYTSIGYTITWESSGDPSSSVTLIGHGTRDDADTPVAGTRTTGEVIVTEGHTYDAESGWHRTFRNGGRTESQEIPADGQVDTTFSVITQNGEQDKMRQQIRYQSIYDDDINSPEYGTTRTYDDNWREVLSQTGSVESKEGYRSFTKDTPWHELNPDALRNVEQQKLERQRERWTGPVGRSYLLVTSATTNRKISTGIVLSSTLFSQLDSYSYRANGVRQSESMGQTIVRANFDSTTGALETESTEVHGTVKTIDQFGVPTLVSQEGFTIDRNVANKTITKSITIRENGQLTKDGAATWSFYDTQFAHPKRIDAEIFAPNAETLVIEWDEAGNITAGDMQTLHRIEEFFTYPVIFMSDI